MTYITYAITNYCNFNCPMCPAGVNRRRTREAELNTYDIDKNEAMLVDCFNPTDTAVELTGGEPTLSFMFGKIMQMLMRHGYNVTILTNCSNLSAIPEYGKCRVIGTYYPRFMSEEELEKQVKSCRSDFYLAVYPNTSDAGRCFEISEKLNAKRVIGAWNNCPDILEKIPVPHSEESLTMVYEDVCREYGSTVFHLSNYSGSESHKSMIKSAVTKADTAKWLISKSWQAMNHDAIKNLTLNDFSHIPYNGIHSSGRSYVKHDR